MRKLLSFLSLSFILMFFISESHSSLYFSIRCINNSCQASAGDVSFFWSGHPDGGTLTGVKLPVNVEKLDEISKIADQTVEKVLTRSKEKSAQAELNHSVLGAGKENAKQSSISQKRSMILQQKLGASFKEDVTLKFFEFYANNDDICRVQKRPIDKWMCAVDGILISFKNGDIADKIYGYFLHEKLKNIPSEELEKQIVENIDSVESVDIANYLLNFRKPLEFNKMKVKDYYLEKLKAFYSKDLLQAYKIDQDAAYVKYLVEKKIINIKNKPEISYIHVCTHPVLFAEDNYGKYINEFKNEIKKLQYRSYAKKTLFVISFFLLVFMVVFIIKKRKCSKS